MSIQLTRLHRSRGASSTVFSQYYGLILGKRFTTHINVPNTFSNIITSGPSARLCCAFASNVFPSILLEVPDTLGEEAGSDEVEKACRDDKENLQRCLVASLVDEVPDKRTSTETTEHGQGERCSRKTKANTGNKPDKIIGVGSFETQIDLQNSFNAFTEHGDEWQHKHGILLRPCL